MWISFQIVPHNKEKIRGGREDLNKNRLFFLNESFTGTKKKLLIEAQKTSKRFALQVPRVHNKWSHTIKKVLEYWLYCH